MASTPNPALGAYLEMLAGSDFPWGVAVPGGCVTDTGMSRLAIEWGGHIRIGLEDYMNGNQSTNIVLIEKAIAISRQAGRAIENPAQAAEILRVHEPVVSGSSAASLATWCSTFPKH
jgi:3-keto-5-aminohexanoate cleavage enzyme